MAPETTSGALFMPRSAAVRKAHRAADQGGPGSQARREPRPRRRADRHIPDEVVARIRPEYRAGATLSQVADGLTADGVPTSQGGRRWYASTISGVLKRHGEPARRRERR